MKFTENLRERAEWTTHKWLRHIRIEIKKYVKDTIFKYEEFIPNIEAGWIKASRSLAKDLRVPKAIYPGQTVQALVE